MATRRRCAECRKTFKPAPSARATQRVCGEACRAARDQRLARARRRRDLDDARADERERQQASRTARAAAGCHTPPSPRKCLLSPQEVRQFVDRALDRSRATLVRELRGVLLRFMPIAGKPEATEAPLSRGSLGAQASDNTEEFGANLAALSRMSLGDRGRP
jgi:hypothetical protein